MIGAAGGSMSSSMPNAGSGARDSAASAAPGAASANAQSSATAANRAADPAATGNDATTTAKSSTSKAAQKAGSDARDARTDFDALLADATAPAAGASPVVAPLPPKALNQAAEAPAETALPDQLLALINGSWALSPAAAPAGNIALADATPGAASPALVQTGPALPTPAGLAQAAIDLPATTPVDGAVPVPATSGDPGAIALSALAAMAEPDFGASGAIDAADSSGLIAELGSTEPPQLPTTSATTALGAARTTSAAPTAAITLPADPDAGFDDAFGSRIVWLADQRLGHAEIRITPDHAGPIDVRLQLDGNRVSADFQSANPDVRQALEASMTRLRDLLGQHGMQLAHAGVGHGQSDRRGGTMATPGPDPEHDAALDPRMSASPVRSRGLLDEYA